MRRILTKQCKGCGVTLIKCPDKHWDEVPLWNCFPCAYFNGREVFQEELVRCTQDDYENLTIQIKKMAKKQEETK